jgi:hypothetical protein
MVRVRDLVDRSLRQAWSRVYFHLLDDRQNEEERHPKPGKKRTFLNLKGIRTVEEEKKSLTAIRGFTDHRAVVLFRCIWEIPVLGSPSHVIMASLTLASTAPSGLFYNLRNNKQ